MPWPRGDWVSWLRGDWTSWLRTLACGPLALRAALADSTSAHCCAADADGGPSIMRQVSDTIAGTSLFLKRTNARGWRQEPRADRHDRRGKAYTCNETTCPLRAHLPRVRVRGREYSRDAP